MYIIHLSQRTSPGIPPEYVMYQLKHFDVSNSAKAFRNGATFYRNASDVAQKYRDEAIQGANKRAV